MNAIEHNVMFLAFSILSRIAPHAAAVNQSLDYIGRQLSVSSRGSPLMQRLSVVPYHITACKLSVSSRGSPLMQHQRAIEQISLDITFSILSRIAPHAAFVAQDTH